MPSRILLWSAVFVMTVVSCSEPSVYGNFVKIADADSSGRYRFTLEMTDSLSRYDIYFYTRIDAVDRDAESVEEDIPVNVMLVSPSGVRYTEKVYIRRETNTTDSRYYGDYDVLWRKDSVPVTFGSWLLYLSTDSNIPGFRGFGIRVMKK